MKPLSPLPLRLCARALALLIFSSASWANPPQASAPSGPQAETLLVQTPLSRKERTAFGRYHRGVRTRIETCANRGLLREQEINVSGSVVVSYAIERTGQLDEVKIHTPSGQAELDEVIVSIIQSCGPVEPFPKTLAPRIERMTMNSSMSFTSQPQRAHLRFVLKP